MIKNKCKACRRLGQKLFLKGERCLSPKCAMVKRAYPPGLAGKRRKRRLSDYGKALREKQRLRSWYGLSERQFKKYVKEVLSKRGKVENLAEEFIKKLEKRLDNVIFRLGFSKSRSQARQLVLHGYFLINKKPITMPSYEVKKGDAIAIKEGKKRKTALKDLSATLKKKQVASWLKIDKDKLEAELTGEPSLGEVLPPAEIPTIFEYYSR
ncbi:MAG: 30S ribosomal protein S4 [Candidatus Staskawiczbacteria bacterium CG10_big_fil_rev_8_21_14_0_10_38_10]|uniref:Small ribosomal subunit protein uS4 n=1 Tax=Candidatus Staskawiczbacteria bacterium CG10_big_fil_rev_8_21_14_0_10_38_10 TaxID=1974891 RepID=A0A2H9T1R8_9BACT|nr:MAG: 30S ribosomal protein S4 [Candidatus Staskawiczbacteria bacterium CG10_big_fil_rev_8_21_14_0_10_38_10]